MEEKFDIIDNEGKPTGVTKTRHDVHRDGDLHVGAHIWIRSSKGNILIQQRSDEKENFPGLYDTSCAGHVSAGETPQQGAVRELQEELGLSVKSEQLRHLFRIYEKHILRNGTYIDNEWHEIFLVDLEGPEKNPDDFILQQEEVGKVAWVSVPELKRRITEESEAFVPHPEEYEKIIAFLSR